jgi:hypothetical protein
MNGTTTPPNGCTGSVVLTCVVLVDHALRS